MFSNHLDISQYDIIEYIDIPIYNGQLNIRYVKRIVIGDWWYEADFDDKGYILFEKSSHPMLCGSKEVHYLYYQGRLIYLKDDFIIRISKHDSSWEFVFKDNQWKKRQFTIFSDWVTPTVNDLKSITKYILPKIRKSPHKSDIELLEKILTIR